MIYPSNFETKTGFDRIRAMIKAKCLCSLGKDKADAICFIENFEQIDLLLNQTEEFRQICLFEENFPVDHFVDLTPFLKRARIEGMFLTEIELFDMKRSLETIRAILRFFKNKTDDKYPHLNELTKEVTLYPLVLEKIDGIINSRGQIKDNASQQLALIRKEMSQKLSSVSKRILAILKQAQNEGWVESDVSVSLRDGRMVIPINSSNKRKIKGLVHDESATGKTSYIEPVEVVELNNEIKELEYAEKREITKILTDFTNFLRPYIDDLLKSYDFLGTIDFIRAKALFALEIEAIKPAFIDEQIIQWDKARHPLLYLSHKKDDKPIVPLDIQLTPKARILLISGPNAGGKSVCLQTVGLLQYMLQCGLLVCVKEGSTMGIFRHIFIDIGDEQSIENDLSTYSSHLLNMKFFAKNADDKTLLLIDEFGTGTEPMLGGAIAEAVLNHLNNNLAFGVITTHYTNLKVFAGNTPGIVNGAMLFDAGQMQPLYMLEIGRPGSSFAFEMARKIGLPENILQEATQKIGKDHVDFDKNLRNVLRDKRYWEQKRENIRKIEKRMEETTEKYATELTETQQLRKSIIDKARQEAAEILSKTNRQIENTIRIIKETQAEKERTKVAREQLEDFKQKIANPADSEDDQLIARKMEQIKNRQERQKSRKPPTGKTETVKAPETEKEMPIVQGDKVRLAGQETIGEVIEINNKNAYIAFGSMITSLPLERLEKITNNEYRRAAKMNKTSGSSKGIDLGSRKLNFKSSIDIRGMRGDEAISKVADFIDEAIMVQTNEVRILHGKGNGILRQLVRDYLKTIDLVKSFADEAVEFGGAGITVVKF